MVGKHGWLLVEFGEGGGNAIVNPCSSEIEAEARSENQALYVLASECDRRVAGERRRAEEFLELLRDVANATDGFRSGKRPQGVLGQLNYTVRAALERDQQGRSE